MRLCVRQVPVYHGKVVSGLWETGPDGRLHHFSPAERRLFNPHYYKVDISDDLYNLKMSIIGKQLVKEIDAFKLGE